MHRRFWTPRLTLYKRHATIPIDALPLKMALETCCQGLFVVWQNQLLRKSTWANTTIHISKKHIGQLIVTIILHPTFLHHNISRPPQSVGLRRFLPRRHQVSGRFPIRFPGVGHTELPRVAPAVGEALLQVRTHLGLKCWDRFLGLRVHKKKGLRNQQASTNVIHTEHLQYEFNIRRCLVCLQSGSFRLFHAISCKNWRQPTQIFRRFRSDGTHISLQHLPRPADAL